jgi:hypothetical protein
LSFKAGRSLPGVKSAPTLADAAWSVIACPQNEAGRETPSKVRKVSSRSGVITTFRRTKESGKALPISVRAAFIM